MPSSSHVPSHYAHDNERAGHTVVRDTESVNALYERYLRNAVFICSVFSFSANIFFPIV